MMTMEEALKAKYFHDSECNNWRRNGATKLWKTRPTEFRIPIKFRLYAYCYIHESNLGDFHLPDSSCLRNRPYQQL